jgi:hypothetical protein
MQHRLHGHFDANSRGLRSRLRAPANNPLSSAQPSPIYAIYLIIDPSTPRH